MKLLLSLMSVTLVIVAFLVSEPAQTQSAGSFVALQSTSPGASQSGNTNINGTSRATSFIGGGSGLTSLSWSALPDGGLTTAKIGNAEVTPAKVSSTGASTGQALIFNGSAVTWGAPSASLTLPYSGTTSASATAFDVSTTSLSSRASRFSINNNQNSNIVVDASTNGFGVVGQFSATNADHQNPALVALTQGQSVAAHILINNSNNSAPALLVSTNGSGDAAQFEGRVHATGLISSGGTSPNAQIYGEGGPINGVIGNSSVLNGVQGVSTSDFASGVYGENMTGIGVAGRSFGGLAGFFEGNVMILGNFEAAGFKSFKIDHPMDPENKYLIHYNLESDEPLNVYRGNVQLNSRGEAIVELASYVDAIGKDFHYQLTPIGSAAVLFVKKKFENNRFIIAGGKSGMEVSWTLTAVRDDAYARTKGSPVEIWKPERERGTYLQPKLFGQSQDRGTFDHIGRMPRD